MERRKYRRFGVRLPVSFSYDRTEGQGQIVNISMGGCAVESEIDVGEGAFVRLKVALPDREKPTPMEVDLAPVRWSKDGKFGMEFIDMAQQAKKQLYRLVSSLKASVNPPGTQ